MLKGVLHNGKFWHRLDRLNISDAIQQLGGARPDCEDQIGMVLIMKRVLSQLAGSLLVLCGVCTAQSIQGLSVGASARTAREALVTPQAIRLQNAEYVIPELILGGEWTSTIKLTNQGVNPVPTTNVYFLDNSGYPMTATFRATDGSVVTDTGFSFSLGVGNLVEATFVGGTNTQFGHAVLGICDTSGCTPGLYGEVALKNRNATRPDFESVFPLEQPAAVQYMLFDGRSGFTTVLYLVNDNPTTSTVVSLDVIDTSNRLIRTVTVTLFSFESQILTLHVLAPETIGIQGTLVIRGQNNSGAALVTATALRINPSNSFTPLRAFVPTR